MFDHFGDPIKISHSSQNTAQINACMPNLVPIAANPRASPRAASLAAREGAGMYVHFALKITYTGIIYGIYRINKSINY